MPGLLPVEHSDSLQLHLLQVPGLFATGPTKPVEKAAPHVPGTRRSLPRTTLAWHVLRRLQQGALQRPTYPRPGLLDSWPHKGKQHVEMDTGEFAQTYDRTNNIERTPGLLAVEREWQWLTTCGTC